MTSLCVENIHCYYGKSHIVQDASLHVEPGEIVTLLGRNGAGKTSTLKSISGLLPPRGGKIWFGGKEITGQASYCVARNGLSLVPENRGIFRLLSVEENLAIAVRKGSPWAMADIYRIFPRLEERKRNGGAQLSGGEQQMLAIARAMLCGPKLLMLDEPVEGLAPVIVDEIVRQIKEIRQAGVSILLVEQNLAVCNALADRHCIIELGSIVYEADKSIFAADKEARERYLGTKV